MKYRDLVMRYKSHYHLADVGWRTRPPNYDVWKMFNPHAYSGKLGIDSNLYAKTEKVGRDEEIIDRLINRFPALKLMPMPTYYREGFGMANSGPAHPAQTFINKYNQLLNKGWSKENAYEEIERELEAVFEEQRDDLRILRGAALAMHGHSYLDHAQ